MDIPILEILAVAFGLIIRIGIPILLTGVLAIGLKWLDKRWQAEAQAEAAQRDGRLALPMAGHQACWEIHNCPPALRDNCPAYTNLTSPCWEVFRSNGRLKAACRSCKVPPPEIADLLTPA